jgi:transcriptional regulator with XRE-family HTH domain
MQNNNFKIPTSNKLKECRMKARLTQFDAMLKLGVRSTDRISKWENGTRLPNLINLFKLAEIYGVTPKELYPEIAQVILLSQTPPEDLSRG